jgi:hypothetical protein
MPGLSKQRGRNVVEAHAGVKSVNTDGGLEPRQHDCSGDCAESNAEFNEASRGPREAAVIMTGGK